MNTNTKPETAREVILRTLSEDGSDGSGTSLGRILANYQECNARQISPAIQVLISEGLVEKGEATGRLHLTQAGRAATNLKATLDSPWIRETFTHPGGLALDMNDGTLNVGIGPDWSTQRCKLWNHAIGTLPILAIGSTGSGGTNMLNGLIEASLPHHPSARVWLIDNNAQMSEYWGSVEKVAADHAIGQDAGVIDTSYMLDQVIQAQHDRSRKLAGRGKRDWTGPDSGLPLGILVLGQLEEVVRDVQAKYKLAQIVKMARKTGVLVAAHAASPLLASFGNDMMIQDFFGAGNIFTFRQAIKSTFGRMMTERMAGLPMIPREFEDGMTTAGVGYMPDGTLMRTYWAPGI